MNSEHNLAPDSRQQQLIDGYEALLDRFSMILDSAQEGEWAAVIEQESSYLAEAERLRYLEADTTLDPALEVQKASLARQILQQSAEVQRHLTARRDALGELIQEAGNRRNIDQTYLALNDSGPGSWPRRLDTETQ